jgi:RNA polymerase-binding transcription factor DksA
MSDREQETAAPATRRLTEARAQTLQQIAALRRNFEGIVEAALLVNTDDEHDPEGATIAFERAQVSALSKQADADLAAIDDALERLRRGSYGRCEVCAGPIGDERLDAIPSATRCIACASMASSRHDGRAQ